jgi:hypothetical protein
MKGVAQGVAQKFKNVDEVKAALRAAMINPFADSSWLFLISTGVALLGIFIALLQFDKHLVDREQQAIDEMEINRRAAVAAAAQRQSEHSHND